MRHEGCRLCRARILVAYLLEPKQGLALAWRRPPSSDNCGHPERCAEIPPLGVDPFRDIPVWCEGAA
jgi:hypothetical protein